MTFNGKAMIMTDERQPDVLELVVFSLNEGVTREQLLGTVGAVSAWARRRPGFISRDLSYNVEQNKWIEVVYWAGREDVRMDRDTPPRPAGRAPRDRGADTDLDELTGLALAARDGDRAALESLCRHVQQPMYRLALRFCGDPHDAQDATQEVLIRLVTHLGSFEGRSKFTTWAYTVAVRQLMRTSRRAAEASVAGPIDLTAFLDAHAADPAFDPAARAEYDELCADVRLSCTYGMLLCLSREQRIAYLVGDLLRFTDADGARICDISPAAFRQRLARARAVMRQLMGQRCGLVRASNPCRCDKLVRASVDAGILDPADPRWARHGGVSLPIETTTLDTAARELDLAVAVAEVYRSGPPFAAPEEVWSRLARALPTLLAPPQ
jgi:RNA polymerase sigma factor (sigma-70 family)